MWRVPSLSPWTMRFFQPGAHLVLAVAEPASRPPARVLHGIRPMPWYSKAGITSNSIARVVRFYRLCSDTRPKPATIRDGLRDRDVPAGEVAAADTADLPLPNQLLHRLPDLLPRSGPVHVMHLIQIDMVGAEPAQTRLTSPPDVECGQPAVVRPEPHRLSLRLGGDPG
jgi:hypothetical protein